MVNHVLIEKVQLDYVGKETKQMETEKFQKVGNFPDRKIANLEASEYE